MNVCTFAGHSVICAEPFKFHAAGFMRHGQIDTYDVDALESKPLALGHILEKNVDEHYYFTVSQIERLKYYKSSKQFIRTRKSGETYNYSEGAIPFPDSLESPARTLITSEGSVSRTSHVICDPETGRLRRLTPTECERLQGFPDEWTVGMSERMRYKTMGNALVVPMISRIASVLDAVIEEE